MRELIQVSIGQTGCAVGYEYWETISREHGLSQDGSSTSKIEKKLEKIDVSFQETHGGNFVPRAIMVDLDPSGMNYVLKQNYASLFNPNNLFSGKQGAHDNWAKGMYTTGREEIDKVLDQIRRQVENCDSFQGFLITHSLSGGTGSGVGSLIIQKFREYYCNKQVNAFTLYPSQDFIQNSLEPYNTVLATNELTYHTDLNICYDLQSLYKNSQQIPNQNGYKISNQMIAQAMSSQTSSIRFPGQLNGSLIKQAANLVPYHRMHFVMNSQISSQTSDILLNSQLIKQLHEQDSFLVSSPKLNDLQCNMRTFTSWLQVRGQNISTCEYETSNSQQRSRSLNQCDWIPNNNGIGFCNKTSSDKNKVELSLLVNSQSINPLFVWICERFTKMFRRKSYLHQYTYQGMDEMEFIEAESNLNDLASEYQGSSDAQQEENNDEEEQEPSWMV